MTNESLPPDVSRRGFIAAGVASSAYFMAASAHGQASGAVGGRPQAAETAPGPFRLEPLPFKEDALDPYIQAKTIGFHYGRHHKGYVDKLNKQVEGKRYEKMKLEEVVQASAKEQADVAVFNNAAQAWNHAFYWQCLKANGGGEPTGRIADKIKSDFGSYDELKKQLSDAALNQFGSGWAWLVVEGGKLRVQKTSNADTPIAHGIRPLLTIDVWEHAYYLDYQNRRNEYVAAVIDHLLNWEFAGANLA